MTMTMEKVCLFNMYGFCKFRETCHKTHFKEICEDESCETSNCFKRHPVKCKYFEIYNRCKFGSFCLFSHKTTDVKSLDEVEELKVRNATLEKHVDKLENEIKVCNARLENLEEKIRHLENKVESVSETMRVVCEVTIKKAIENVTDMIFKQQDTTERKQKECFDLLSQQLAILIPQSQPPSANPSKQPNPCPGQQPHASSHTTQPSSHATFKCDPCGKTFGSERTLRNHTRKDHQP